MERFDGRVGRASVAVARGFGPAVITDLLALTEIRPVSRLSPISNQAQTRCNLHEPWFGTNCCEIRPEQYGSIDGRLKSRIVQKLIDLIDATEISEGLE